jgi:hypothetical protein
VTLTLSPASEPVPFAAMIALRKAVERALRDKPAMIETPWGFLDILSWKKNGAHAVFTQRSGPNPKPVTLTPGRRRKDFA